MNIRTKLKPYALTLGLFLSCALVGADAGARAQSKPKDQASGATNAAAPAAHTPSETVRAFYDALREKRFRDAFAMSIFRPAIDGLSEQEFDELRPDFELRAAEVPAVIELTGEQISGEDATVFMKLGEGKDVKVEPVYLIRERGAWIVGDRESAGLVKKQGRKFFFEQRMAAHEADVEDMLKRISAAQIAFALQHAGAFGDLNALVDAAFVPKDILGTETTGYHFSVAPGARGKGYTAHAEPARYGRTGRLSFYLDPNGLQKKDTGGKPFDPPAAKK
jgi:hypothetical protein